MYSIEDVNNFDHIYSARQMAKIEVHTRIMRCDIRQREVFAGDHLTICVVDDYPSDLSEYLRIEIPNLELTSCWVRVDPQSVRNFRLDEDAV